MEGYNFDKRNENLYRVSSRRVPKQKAMPIQLGNFVTTILSPCQMRRVLFNILN